MPQTHIVSFSTGLSSALTVERVLNRYGPEHTEIVFMDTKIEDKDNYRFLEDCRERWGKPIQVLTEGHTPYQIAKREQIIPNQKIAPCTFRLKIEPFTSWLAERESITIHIGYDYTEAHRCGPTTKAYLTHGWNVDFPLLWEPLELRPYTQVVGEDWGIVSPRMYAMGYTHANCGGMCVKQGQGDWLRTLLDFPDRYNSIEIWEEKMRQHPIRQDYAILRDQSKGTVTPLTLKEFRARHELEQEIQPTLFQLDFNSGCLQCGVGDLANEELMA